MAASRIDNHRLAGEKPLPTYLGLDGNAGIALFLLLKFTDQVIWLEARVDQPGCE